MIYIIVCLLAIAIVAWGLLMFYPKSQLTNKPTDLQTAPATPFTEKQNSKTSLTKIKEDGSFAYYEGVITVSGKYQESYIKEPGYLNLCFYVNKETVSLIPRRDNDNRDPWFCFDNQEKAKTMFGIDDSKIIQDGKTENISGNATIEVSNYKLLLGDIMGNDSATLDKIITKEVY